MRHVGPEADPDDVGFASEYWAPEQYARLQQIKAQVDPTNLFACWQCVEPSATSTAA